MREMTAAPVEHPLLDFGGPGFAATETRTPVVFLSEARVNLLAATAAAGKKAVLVTDELSLLTPALAAVWREAGAAWVVRSRSRVGGRLPTPPEEVPVAGALPTWVRDHPPTRHTLREGFSGRRLDSVGDVLTAAPVRGADDVDLGFLRPTPADAVQLSVLVSLRHPARSSTLLGGPAAGLAELVTGRPPRVWGAHEPAGEVWDRETLTTVVRDRMPGPLLTVVSGEGFAATLTVQRTSSGIEEITEAQLSLGVPSTLAFEDLRRRLLDWLAELTATTMPLVALVLARPGRADLLVPPLLTHPPTPLALLIGPPGVRGMKVDVDALVTRFGALRVGRPRIPGVLFGLGTLGEPGWQRLDEVLGAVGREQVLAATGLAPRHLEGGPTDAQQP